MATAVLEFLEAQRATRPELAEWYAALADLYQRKLWHQLTLKLDQFLALAVVQVLLIPSMMIPRFIPALMYRSVGFDLVLRLKDARGFGAGMINFQ
jgi:hypothetical protein